MHKMSKTLDPKDIIAIVDTREQLPLDLSPMSVVRKTLSTADYSAIGLENELALERKSLQDLIACMTRDRERFEKVMQRMLAYPVRAVLVECTWQDLEAGNWISKLSARAATGSVISWMCKGIPFIFTGTRERSSSIVSRMIYHTAKQRHDQLIRMVYHKEDPHHPMTSKTKNYIEGVTSSTTCIDPNFPCSSITLKEFFTDPEDTSSVIDFDSELEATYKHYVV